MTPIRNRIALLLPLAAAVAALSGCPGLPNSPLDSGNSSPRPSVTTAPNSTTPTASPTTAATAAPTAQAAPAVTPKEGLASQAYFLTVEQLKADGYKNWELYRLEGKNLPTNGVISGANQSYVLYFKTPSDNKTWRATLVAGGENTLEAETDAAIFKSGYAITLPNWKVDSREAVTAAGGTTSGSLFLYSAAEFKARTGKTASNPVWIINVGGGQQAHIDASTGAKL